MGASTGAFANFIYTRWRDTTENALISQLFGRTFLKL